MVDFENVTTNVIEKIDFVTHCIMIHVFLAIGTSNAEIMRRTLAKAGESMDMVLSIRDAKFHKKLARAVLSLLALHECYLPWEHSITFTSTSHQPQQSKRVLTSALRSSLSWRKKPNDSG